LTGVSQDDIVEVMAITKIWTDARRRIVSKTLFDIVKLEVAAVFASKFLEGFQLPVKIAVVVATIITAMLAFSLYPKEGD
jgi:hypothetical protein